LIDSAEQRQHLHSNETFEKSKQFDEKKKSRKKVNFFLCCLLVKEEEKKNTHTHTLTKKVGRLYIVKDRHQFV
jgi:hypothetical protein